MRVSIADDSVLFREGLRRVLADLDVDVIAAVGTGSELLDEVDTQHPDVAILDIRMPPTFTDEGLVTAGRLRERRPNIGILLLSTYAEGASAARLLADGSQGKGYLLKDRVDDPEMLRDALDRLSHGGTVVDRELVAELVESRQLGRDLAALTDRERAVLTLMAEGQSNIGIGRQLFLSPKTVETHVSAIFAKLQVPSSTNENRRVTAVLSWLRLRGL